MSGKVQIRTMTVADALAIQKQASQRLQVGLEIQMSADDARELIEHGEAWAALRGDQVIACMGIRETFPGRQGVAWAILAEGVGAAHLAITRHARRRIRESPLVRIEAIVRPGIDVEAVVAAHPDLDPYAMLEVVVSQRGPEVVWALLVGLKPNAVCRKFGALSEGHLLFERIA